jgi:hypothetical protein
MRQVRVCHELEEPSLFTSAGMIELRHDLPQTPILAQAPHTPPPQTLRPQVPGLSKDAGQPRRHQAPQPERIGRYRLNVLLDLHTQARPDFRGLCPVYHLPENPALEADARRALRDPPVYPDQIPRAE